jgi:hypothetical protein
LKATFVERRGHGVREGVAIKGWTAIPEPDFHTDAREATRRFPARLRRIEGSHATVEGSQPGGRLLPKIRQTVASRLEGTITGQCGKRCENNGDPE